MLLCTALAFALAFQPTKADGQEPASLKAEIEVLRAQQIKIEAEVQALKTLLQALGVGRMPASRNIPEAIPGLVGKGVSLERLPTLGTASAPITIVEVSDYHCPFCRRVAQQVLPNLLRDYIETGKARYAFLDLPIASIHQDAIRSHEAAACAGDQGLYWQMHAVLFASPPTRDLAELISKGIAIGADTNQYAMCLRSGKYHGAIVEQMAQAERLSIASTPVMLIGQTPAVGEPMTITHYIFGAQPYPTYATTIDGAVAGAR